MHKGNIERKIVLALVCPPAHEILAPCVRPKSLGMRLKVRCHGNYLPEVFDRVGTMLRHVFCSMRLM